MKSFQILCSLATLIYLENTVQAQQLVSPCPQYFVYLKRKEADTWDGIVTLVSDTDLAGIWLRLIFDRPSLQLGNWFGTAEPREENKEYLIKNRNFQLKANMRHPVKFFVKFDPNQPAPKLVGFRLNARTLCPEGADATTAPKEVFTSGPLTSRDSVDNSGSSIIRPGGIDLVSAGIGEAFPSFDGPTLAPNPTSIELENICGSITVALVRPLITSGELASEGEYPWHAALYQTKGVNLEYLCGASLVTKQHIITAAHCVTKPRTATARDADSLVIYLGRYFLHRFTKGIQEKLVENIYVHPEYNPQRYSNDISVVKFSSPVEISDYVRPVCLWQESPDLNAIQSRLGSVVGWGFDESGKLTEQLMQAKMPVVSQETCLLSEPNSFPLFTSNRTYCAGFRNGTSVCNGDSGGGMVFPKPDQDRLKWQLRGIVSLSIDPNKQFKCDTKHFIIFTDVAKYLSWIRRSLLL